jgi:hypothetical protein
MLINVWVAWIVIAITALALAACSSPAMVAVRTPEPAAFDLSLVRAHFTGECIHPTFDADEACQRMDIDGMTADGSILNIPTDLNPSNVDRAREYCRLPATSHYGAAKGEDLGYHTIRILDYNGGTLYECYTVGPPG